MYKENSIRSVNWHVTLRCNYHCKFCYMKDLEIGIADILDTKTVLSRLKELGIEKLNIAGGEPLLYPFTYDIIKMAHAMGFVTSITTNGSLLTKSKIEMFSPYLDWIGLSVDSKYENVEKKLGRGCGNHINNIIKVSSLISNSNIKLKINTTVTKINHKENLKPLIRTLNPDRWKIFQILHIKEQNDAYIEKLSVSDEEFKKYVNLNEGIVLKSGEKPVFERCEDMVDSYFMLSPSGDILVNSKNIYTIYPLESVKSNEEIEKLVSVEKYSSRGGNYQWN